MGLCSNSSKRVSFCMGKSTDPYEYLWRCTVSIPLGFLARPLTGQTTGVRYELMVRRSLVQRYGFVLGEGSGLSWGIYCSGALRPNHSVSLGDCLAPPEVQVGRWLRLLTTTGAQLQLNLESSACHDFGGCPLSLTNTVVGP